MSNKLIVTEVLLADGHKHARHFRLPIDPKGGEFNYRSRTSINCFFYGKKRRNYKGIEILYHVADEHEHKSSLKITQQSLPHWPTPFYIDVDSIWDFYKIIKYDYKTKKWL